MHRGFCTERSRVSCRAESCLSAEFAQNYSPAHHAHRFADGFVVEPDTLRIIVVPDGPALTDPELCGFRDRVDICAKEKKFPTVFIPPGEEQNIQEGTGWKIIDMTDYRLIAFDMDGTLLRSDKTISDGCIDAVHEAVAAGKSVAVCSGRPLAEIRPYADELREVRYFVCECGALIYDRIEKKILVRHTLDPNVAGPVLDAIAREDIMPQALMAGESYVNPDDIVNMTHFHMAVYRTLYTSVARREKDVPGLIRAHCGEIEKINLYHASIDGRERTKKRLQGVGVDLTYAEASSLELSRPGITKGSGLAELAERLGIPIQAVIAVGDADNDVPMIRAAGLGLCMKNGTDAAKSAAAAILPDNDHDGCAFAIRHCLLRI